MFNVINDAIAQVFWFVERGFDILFAKSYFAGINLYLRPVLFIGVAISIIFIVFKIIRSTIWGR